MDAVLALGVPNALELLDVRVEGGSEMTPPMGPQVELGDLESGQGATVVARLAARAPAEAAILTAVVTASGLADVSGQVMLEIREERPAVVLRAGARELLVEGGDEVHYQLLVTNEGSSGTGPVQVIDLAPAEIDVDVGSLTMNLPPQAGSVLYGEFRGEESITWDIPRLRAGASVELTWVGRAVDPGDLTAVNRARAEVRGTVLSRATHTTYVGHFATSATTNPVFEPVVESRAITRPAPVEGSGALPVTGASLTAFGAVGLLLLCAGAGLARRAPPGWLRRPAASLLVIAAVVTSACVGSDEGTEPQVKGQRIERNGGDGPGGSTGPEEGEPDGGGGAGEDEEPPGPENSGPDNAGPDNAGPENSGPDNAGEADPDAGGQAPPETSDEAASAPSDPGDVAAEAVDETGVVSTVVVETLQLGDLPLVRLGPLQGTNAISHAYDAAHDRLAGAASSLTLARARRPVTLLTAVDTRGPGIRAVLTLRNRTAQERLRVDGVIALTVMRAGRRIARFESRALRSVLSPGGSQTVAFSYAVPSGNYELIASFVPRQKRPGTR